MWLVCEIRKYLMLADVLIIAFPMEDVCCRGRPVDEPTGEIVVDVGRVDGVLKFAIASRVDVLSVGNAFCLAYNIKDVVVFVVVRAMDGHGCFEDLFFEQF